MSCIASRSVRHGLLAAVIAAATLACAPSPACAETRVYLMRGLLDVSTGLDDLAAKLKRRGITATVASYAAEVELAQTAIRGFKSGKGCPVVVIGHSLGADAALDMARDLQIASVPVALLVAFSPARSDAVPGNVARVVNYYQSNSYWNYAYSRGPGFKGSLRNVDLAKRDDIDHFNIEKSAGLHAATIRAIRDLDQSCQPAPAPKAPDVAEMP